MCDAHLFGGSLLCDRTDAHETGHRYHSAWTADRHDNYDPEEGR